MRRGGSRGTGRAMDVVITVDPVPAARLTQAVDRATQPAAYARFHYAFTSPYMRSKARERFAMQGDDASGRWAHLTDATEDIRDQLGFPPEEPINVRTHEMESFVLGRPGEVTITPVDAALHFPARPPAGPMKHKIAMAQRGTQGAPTMVFGRPVGRPTPPRPVAAMDATDLIHTMSALQIFLTHEIRSWL